MDLGIKGKRALVCASSKGLGLGCAEALAEAGVDLVMNARGAADLETAAERIRQDYGVEVTTIAADWATVVSGWLSILPFEVMSPPTLTLLFTLIMTAVVCILMGCGIPTTANYLIMIAVAAPILSLLGVQPLVAHFFVFYFAVVSAITPLSLIHI